MPYAIEVTRQWTSGPCDCGPTLPAECPPINTTYPGWNNCYAISVDWRGCSTGLTAFDIVVPNGSGGWSPHDGEFFMACTPTQWEIRIDNGPDCIHKWYAPRTGNDPPPETSDWTYNPEGVVSPCPCDPPPTLSTAITTCPSRAHGATWAYTGSIGDCCTSTSAVLTIEGAA
jgi:hypothetical protein